MLPVENNFNKMAYLIFTLRYFDVSRNPALECLAFVTKLIRSHAVSPRWLDDGKECIQSAWSKQRDCCSKHTKSRPRMLVAPKAVFQENYLEVSTWILNGSSIECLEKKHQPFSLSGVRFGSRAIEIFSWKSAWRWEVEFKRACHPRLLL